MKKKISVLLAAHDPAAGPIRDVLLKEESVRFEVVPADNLEEALRKLSGGQKTDVILLDPALPGGSQALDGFTQIHARIPSIPVVILAEPKSEAFAAEALRQGALDYVFKGADPRVLVRAVTYAIERNRAEVELRNLLLIDELTGLYNRRGFMTFAEQYMKLAQRTNEGLILIFGQLENLRQIKEAFGGHEADLAVIRTAKTLRDTFRKSDILGHIGADYFSIVTMETSRDRIDMITSRLHEKLKTHNAQPANRYKLVMSFGLTYFDPRVDHTMTIEDLMSKADEALIAQRNQRPG